MTVQTRTTVAAVRALLRAYGWRPCRDDPARESRRAELHGGAVSIAEEVHTGTKVVTVWTTWYTGVPSRRWESKSFTRLADAVNCANTHSAAAIAASEAELGVTS